MTSSPARADHRLVPWLLGLAALMLAAIGARPYAGGWNDGSRLAAVESLADRHTLAIDGSLFCQPPAQGHSPYRPDDPLLAHGTLDKLYIGGHYYSEKPAVITGLMAGLYETARCLGLPPAQERPDLFAWVMTLATAAPAYVVAVLALYFLGGEIGLAGRLRLAWVASFGLATCALTYTRHVNNHILQLAVLAVICWQAVRLARDCEAGRTSWLRLIGLGTLAGLGFNLDFGSGPLLAAALFGLVAYRCRQPMPALVYVLATAPWVAVGLGINHAIGGVWKPMNMVPEYLAWPGSPFSSDNLTGFARHGPVELGLYALALLFGKKGILVHNLPLLLALPALVAVLRRSGPHRPELTFTLGWCGATWLLYAFLSNNSGGACCSIRWFVPFLAPGYYLLAVYLRERPERLADLVALSVWGAVLATIMWWQGPWPIRLVPGHWPIVGAALVTWGILGWRRRRVQSLAIVEEPAQPAIAA